MKKTDYTQEDLPALIKETKSFLATQKLNLAASNLKHYQKIQDEQVTLDAIVGELRETLSPDGLPVDLAEMLATQTKILDAVFGFYLDRAQNAYAEHAKLDMALKAQSQAIRTVNVLCRLKKKSQNSGTN